MLDKESLLGKYPPRTLEPIWGKIRVSLPRERQMHPRIVIHGGYGKKNVGDDAILSAILDRLHESFATPRVVVVCHDPVEVRRLFPKVAAVSFKSPCLLWAILNADVYVVGGGGVVNVINTYSGFSRLRWLDPKGKVVFAAGALAKLMGARLVFYAIGATSFPDQGVRLLVRASLALADAVSVRDPLSLHNLREIGVRREVPVVFDPVTLMQPASPQRAREILEQEGILLEGRSAVLTFRYLRNPAIDNQHTVSEVALLVRGLLERGFRVVFLPFSRHPTKEVEDDRAFLLEVRRQLADSTALKSIDGDYRPEEVMALLGLFDLCILERLHAVLMATMMGRLVVPIVYDHKVDQFAQMVDNPRGIPLQEFSAARVLELDVVPGAQFPSR